MDGEQAGKEVAEVAAEIGIESPVGIDVRNSPTASMVRTSLSASVGAGPRWRSLWAGLAEEVVDAAEDGYDEALEVHGRLLWQQTGVAGCSPLQDSRGSRDKKNPHTGLARSEARRF